MMEYKKQALRICRELGYGRSVYQKLEAATSEAEIHRILVTARQNHVFSDEMKYY